MTEVIWPALFAQRTIVFGGRIVAEFPGLCERQCTEADLTCENLGLDGYREHIKERQRTRDERQCGGCGRWGIFDYRAITANLPNGTIIRGPGKMYVFTGEGVWEFLGHTTGGIQRPNDGCPCCTSAEPFADDDCTCRTDCGSAWCQMGGT